MKKRKRRSDIPIMGAPGSPLPAPSLGIIMGLVMANVMPRVMVESANANLKICESRLAWYDAYLWRRIILYPLFRRAHRKAIAAREWVKNVRAIGDGYFIGAVTNAVTSMGSRFGLCSENRGIDTS